MIQDVSRPGQNKDLSAAGGPEDIGQLGLRLRMPGPTKRAPALLARLAAEGRLFEVAPSSEVVWEYGSSFFIQDPQGFGNRLFHTHRYEPDYPWIARRDLDPNRYANMNRLCTRNH